MALMPHDHMPGLSRHDQGFILPLTLWVIAAMGLAVVAVNEWVGQAVANAGVLQRQADGALALSNIQNELIFAIGTRPMTYRGMEVGRLLEKVDRTNVTALMSADYQTDRYIHLDGKPYKMQSNPDFIVRIYDGRGLVNLNAISGPYIRRILGLFEVDEATRNGMLDALEDYTDRDDLTRISGAEEKDYTRLERRPPANAWLMTPLEAQYVMGWDRVPAIWQRDLEAPLFSTCRITGFNPNTASREALLSNFPDVLEEDIQSVMTRREEKPFRNIREFAAVANTIIRDDPFFFTFAPGACLVVDVTHQPSGDRTRFSLTIDNFSAKTKPWQIDYALHIPQSTPKKPASADREPAPEAVFPAPDTLDADQRALAEDGGAGAPSPMDRQPFNDPSSNF